VSHQANSVFWEFNAQLEITRTWFARTIIHSAGELHYQQAQNLYDGKLSDAERRSLRDYEGMRADLEILMRLGRKLREGRLQRGAVELESQELRFETDKGQPTKLLTKQELEVNKTVAEWMILANESVAKRIHSAYPTHAILRHHPLPRRDHFDNLVRCAATKGFVIDTSSNKRLSHSLAAAVVPSDPSFNKILRTLATQVRVSLLQLRRLSGFLVTGDGRGRVHLDWLARYRTFLSLWPRCGLLYSFYV
jgi:exoribonuclease R